MERRGRSTSTPGRLRDMVPNHVFQLVAMTAMEPPVQFDAELRSAAKKEDVFAAMKPVGPRMRCGGQYRARHGAR